MNRRRPCLLLSACGFAALLVSLASCSFQLPFHTKQEKPEKSPYAGKQPMGHGLYAELQTAPDPLKLSEVRQINVTFILRNLTKNVVTLKFPTTQMIEILIRTPDNGQIISQWSTERTFTSEPRLLVINPEERLEYNEPITTRELKPGTPYTVEAYVVGYEKELRVTKAILPQP